MYFFRRHKKLEGTQCESHVGDRRVHLANERTFLAWIRTAIAIMAFGFIVEKFSFFLKLEMIRKNYEKAGLESAYLLGFVLIGFGCLIGLLAIVHYIINEKDIENNRFKPSVLLDLLFGVILLALILAVVIFFWRWM